MTATPNDDGLTEEQRKRIEQNRLDALERLRQRKERLNQEKMQQQIPPPQVPQASQLPQPDRKRQTTIFASNSPPKEQKPSKPKIESNQSKASKSNVKIVLQLDSPTTFSAPFIPAINPICRSIPGAKYSVQRNLWTFPLSQYSQLLEHLGPKYRPASEDQIPKTVQTMFSQPLPIDPPLSSFPLTGIDNELLSALYPFQREGIVKAINRQGKIILADDMGLGKSIQALGIAAFYRLEWPLLIITPASMVGSWNEQIRRWLPSVPIDGIVAAFKKAPLTGLVNITSYDLAVKLLSERPDAPSFQVIIADECHALKNAESKRSRVLVPLLRAASRAILLSGTPALSRPLELYPQIQAVQPRLFPKFFEYGRRYCAGQLGYFGWDFKGASNLTELQLILERTVMIRRTKDAVLSQLPRKLRHQIFLHLPENVLSNFRKEKGKINQSFSPPAESAEESWLDLAPRNAEYMALWKRTGQVKLPAVLEYLDDLLEAGHKMLIFGHHQEILDGIEGHIVERHKFRSIRIDGRTPTSQRQQLCTAFQDESAIRVAILSITAASTGLTLTAATTVVFTELFWNPGVLVQAEDRAHRIGQIDSVNVHYLLARGTTDDTVWPLILRKLATLESVGLGKNDFGNINRQEHDPAQLRLDKFLQKPSINREEDESIEEAIKDDFEESSVMGTKKPTNISDAD